MKKNKLLPTIIAISILVISCSKQTEIINNLIPNSQVNTLAKDQNTLTLNKWRQLSQNNQKVNFSIAVLLSSEVAISDRENVLNFIKENLTENDANEILSNLEKSNSIKREELLYYKAPWINGNKQLIDKSLMNSDEVKTANINNFENQLKLSVAFSIQNRALKEILDTYEVDSKRAAEIIAPKIAQSISIEDQNAIISDLQKNNNDSALNKIKSAVYQYNKINQMREAADLNLSQSAELTISTIIAYQIYEKIKNTKSFDEINKTVTDLKLINQKRKELIVLSNTIATSIDTMKMNLTNLQSSTKDIKSNTSDIISSLKRDTVNFSNNNRSLAQQMNFMYDKFYKNKNANENSKYSLDRNSEKYAAKFDQLGSNINKASDSILNISHGLNNIVDTVNTAARMLGVNLGSDAQKILNKVQTASKVMSVVSFTMKSFVSGGYVGAASAILGQTGNLFGGGADQTMALMDQKLDQMLNLQKQTIQLQIDTMRMIKDLAQMVDDYHQDEMLAIRDVRSNLLVNLEISKTELNSDLRKCERLISFQLSKLNYGNIKHSHSEDANLIELTQKAFYGNNKSFSNIKSIINSTEFNGFNDCQSGINEAFGNLSVLENPILGIYSTADGSDMKKFEDNVYLPLEQFFISSIQKNLGEDQELSTNMLALHVPIKNYSDLTLKYAHLKNPPSTNDHFDTYELEHFISTAALERYISSLLILYPLIDVDKNTWEKGAVAVIDAFFSDLNIDNNTISISRSYYLLSNALYLTRSAIAQESIMSGEPVFNLIYDEQNNIFSEQISENYKKLNHAIINNPLLLRNYLVYSIIAKNGRFNSDSYTENYNSNDISKLQSFILTTSGIRGEITKVDKKFLIQIKNGASFEIPSVEELNSTEIYYSQNMSKLIKIENKIVDALIQVIPNFDFNNDKKSTSQYQALILNSTL